jgi:hypothetical protein
MQVASASVVILVLVSTNAANETDVMSSSTSETLQRS